MWGQSKISSCCLCVWCTQIKRIRKQRESKIRNTNGGKLLDRVSCRILTNINDGAPLQKYVERLQVIRLMVVVLMIFFTCDKLFLVLWRVCPILWNEYGILGQKYIALLQESEMSLGWHSRSIVLGIECQRIIYLLQISGLMISTMKFTRGGLTLSHGGAGCILIFC